MAQWQCSKQAWSLLLVLMVSQAAALNTYYTVEFPEYSFATQEVTVVYTIEAPHAGSGPAPLSLTSVLDRSESMQGRKLDLLKKTNQFLVDTMMKNNGKHDLGVITYSNLLNELIGLQTVTDSTGPLMNYFIGNIQAAGQTYLSGGLVKGLEQQKNKPSDKVHAVYLFTDGRPTVGPTKSWEILNEVRKIKSSSSVPISIYTFGFGDDVDTRLLWDIAQEGNGVAYVISHENDIPVAFGDALGGILSSVAQDVKCVFKPTHGATIKSVEAPGDINFRGDGSVEVNLYDMYAQEKRDVLITMEVPVASNPGYQKMVYADTSYRDVITKQYTTVKTTDVGCERAAQPVVVAPAERVEVVKIYYVTSEVLEAATEKVDSDDQGGAKEKLEEAERKILDSPLKDRPRLQGLLRDVRKVREAVVDRALSRTRRGGILRNLVSAVRNRRAARTNSDQLETANAQDTETRKKTREQASQGVLGDRGFAVAPAQGGSRLGPLGQVIGEAIGDRIADALTGGSGEDKKSDETDADDGENKDNEAGGDTSDNNDDNQDGDASSASSDTTADDTTQDEGDSANTDTSSQEGTSGGSDNDASQTQETSNDGSGDGAAQSQEESNDSSGGDAAQTQEPSGDGSTVDASQTQETSSDGSGDGAAQSQETSSDESTGDASQTQETSNDGSGDGAAQTQDASIDASGTAAVQSDDPKEAEAQAGSIETASIQDPKEESSSDSTQNTSGDSEQDSGAQTEQQQDEGSVSVEVQTAEETSADSTEAQSELAPVQKDDSTSKVEISQADAVTSVLAPEPVSSTETGSQEGLAAVEPTTLVENQAAETTATQDAAEVAPVEVLPTAAETEGGV